MSPLLAALAPDSSLVAILYIVSFSLFIIGIKQGTHPTTARRGNMIAAVGMAIAVITTLCLKGIGNWGIIIAGILVGTIVGAVASKRVKMTEMPQMVALYNGLGGGAIALIAWSEYRHWVHLGDVLADKASFSHKFLLDFDNLTFLVGKNFSVSASVPLEVMIPTLLAMVVGSISFWGSNVAFAKLQELIPGQPMGLPGQKIINGLLLAALVVGGVILAINNDVNDLSQPLFIAMLVVAALLGLGVVMPIGGADMPVVISLLNAFTGLSAAAAGIALDNTALIVAGTLVGSSGTILTLEMATAMNRSVANILFSGFGSTSAGGGGDQEQRPYRSMNAQDAAIQLAYADSVVIVPGYGLAVAQAQHTVKEMADELQKKGVTVNYAIHPVAGRMPGHMNVLLAEADVPYDQLKEMDEINPELPQTDVCVVIGANDVTNPAAKTDESSPIYGMPIIEVDEAQQVLVLKRSMSAGFAGIDNDLFYNEKTAMVFGDAKSTVQDIVTELGNL
ncbi:MAG TPA: NAD(P)(+) transhydrogenase (Re/Si-specific) subunit beta [Solirubrobacterales bacterium]|nr:NAD(P)(+) transhydrogenase (Re/Si-specific) subunit beta [Solirubrobacterales bacterium]HNF84289.1 NAD(P)(+) transhydrogenase (Re/Si-specific) subunit beta [Solirubrobacterales bacterium]